MAESIFGDDTDSATEAVLIDLLRRATPQQRVSGALSLTNFTRKMSRRAIARAHPTWNDEQVSIEFVRITYGDELAERVQAYIREVR
jgi:hypothetical protein